MRVIAIRWQFVNSVFFFIFVEKHYLVHFLFKFGHRWIWTVQIDTNPSNNITFMKIPAHTPKNDESVHDVSDVLVNVHLSSINDIN